MSLRNDFPRFMLFRDLFPHSERLQLSLLTYYTTLVDFCTKVLEISQRKGQKVKREAHGNH